MVKFDKKTITKKSVDFSRWYTDVILQAKLADYSPVRGCMVIRPYGYAIWKKVHDILDKEFIKRGHEEAYFPVFVPMNLLQKEKKHVEGFSPELAVVTHGGGQELEEPLAVRPTSETITYEMYKDWISSWRDLPLLYYTWNNVVRWEKRTRLFLRTSEFLWHEGHTAHAAHNEALDEVMDILYLYDEFYKNYFAMPGVLGVKSELERFPGAKDTYTVECLMADKKALQAGTSHDLGQNFAKAFSIQFQDKDSKLRHVWQTCWAISSRAIGGLVMTHGDDQGLVLPPKIAPIKAVLIPVLGKEDKKVLRLAKKIKANLDEFKSEFTGKVEIWDDPNYTFGWKANEAELKGIPLAIPIGPKEVKEGKLSLSRRDGNGKLNKKVSLVEIGKKIEVTLKEFQKDLYLKAEGFLKANTYKVDDYDEFKKIMKGKKGFLKAFWCGKKECELKIKEETKATTRCLPLSAEKETGKCIYCKGKASKRWLFAQAY
jgi:prolyl-tRNA synthetase